MNIVWFTCDPGSPKWIAGQRPDVRLTVEVPDDQRLMHFQRWSDRPDRELIGTEPWNAAGCDDWFFFCGDIGADAIIEEMLAIIEKAGWPVPRRRAVFVEKRQ